jgi:hypothetical protein
MKLVWQGIVENKIYYFTGTGNSLRAAVKIGKCRTPQKKITTLASRYFLSKPQAQGFGLVYHHPFGRDFLFLLRI